MACDGVLHASSYYLLSIIRPKPCNARSRSISRKSKLRGARRWHRLMRYSKVNLLVVCQSAADSNDREDTYKRCSASLCHLLRRSRARARAGDFPRVQHRRARGSERRLRGGKRGGGGGEHKRIGKEVEGVGRKNHYIIPFDRSIALSFDRSWLALTASSCASCWLSTLRLLQLGRTSSCTSRSTR
jgi:hypothetical protein